MQINHSVLIPYIVNNQTSKYVRIHLDIYVKLILGRRLRVLRTDICILR